MFKYPAHSGGKRRADNICPYGVVQSFNFGKTVGKNSHPNVGADIIRQPLAKMNVNAKLYWRFTHLRLGFYALHFPVTLSI